MTLSTFIAQYDTPTSDTPWGTYLLLGLIAVVGLIVLGASMRIVQQYERGVVYRFGRVIGERSAGLTLIIPFIDRIDRVVMAVRALSVQAQAAITQDNVTLAVQTVVYYRVVDATKAEVDVEDFEQAIQQLAQSAMRRVIGGTLLNDILEHNNNVSTAIEAAIKDRVASWGLEVQSVEIKDIKLPEAQERSMSAVAEAEREAKAKVAAADGELKSAEKLAEAAALLTPTALELRRLQTLREIALENAVIVIDSQNGAVAAQAAAGQIAVQQNTAAK